MPLKTSPNFSFEKKIWHVKPTRQWTTCLPRDPARRDFTGWRKGFAFVAGVDEAGRGAWAGPIVAAACAFAPQIKNTKIKMQKGGIVIDDSKRLKPHQRELAAKWIKENAPAWDVSEVGVGVINKYGIGKATAKVMRKAICQLLSRRVTRVGEPQRRGPELVSRRKGSGADERQDPSPTNLFLLVDGFHVKYLPGGAKNQKAIVHGDQKSISIAAASILAKVHRDKIMRRLGRNPRCKVYGWGRNKGYGTKFQQKAILRYGLTKLHRKKFVKTWQG